MFLEALIGTMRDATNQDVGHVIKGQKLLSIAAMKKKNKPVVLVFSVFLAQSKNIFFVNIWKQ